MHSFPVVMTCVEKFIFTPPQVYVRKTHIQDVFYSEI